MLQSADADRMPIEVGNRVNLAGQGRDVFAGKRMMYDGKNFLQVNAASICLTRYVSINLQLQLSKGPTIVAIYCVSSASKTYEQMKCITSSWFLVLLLPSTWCM